MTPLFTREMAIFEEQELSNPSDISQADCFVWTLDISQDRTQLCGSADVEQRVATQLAYPVPRHTQADGRGTRDLRLAHWQRVALARRHFGHIKKSDLTGRTWRRGGGVSRCLSALDRQASNARMPTGD